MTAREIARAVLWPLRSRKVLVAVATIASAYAAQFGWNISEEQFGWIMAVGLAVIAGITAEDAAAKLAAGTAPPVTPPSPEAPRPPSPP